MNIKVMALIIILLIIGVIAIQLFVPQKMKDGKIRIFTPKDNDPEGDTTDKPVPVN